MSTQSNETNVIVHMPSFKAIGLKWSGSFAEAGAGDIKHVHAQFRDRIDEIPHPLEADKLLGLSYHAHPGAEGFTHYITMKVDSQVTEAPPGMHLLEVPALLYAKCEHRKGQNIGQSYQNLYKWIEEQGLRASQGDLTHVELYPRAQQPYDPDPEFTILIPVEDD